MKVKDWLDQEAIESNEIGKKYRHLLVDTDGTETYNKLAELTNLKEMNPKDVLDMIIGNDFENSESEEKTEMVVAN